MSESLHPPAFDLVVIGAGINGAGVARDASMRGLKVCVIDKSDIASGTSSWSTRLIHGGLRYLEHWEFGLVRESLRERETLLKIAPHLVKPLPILIPIYKRGRRSSLQVRAGMLLYELLSYDKTLPRYSILSRDETLQKVPGLESEELTASFVYYDAQVEFAERLVLENILDAQQHGTEVITYGRVTRCLTRDGRVVGVEFVRNGQCKTVSGKVIINAAGPWVDHLLQTTGNPNRLIGGTKGSHIIVAPFSGAPSIAVYAEAQSDGRPFFIIPWNNNYLIGTTDIHFDGDPDQARCRRSEVDYLLAETNHVLPGANLTSTDILFTYSGVRPLPFTHIKDEQKITRRHFIRRHHELNNVYSLVGGKLTTYRQLAEECVDVVFNNLEKTTPKCSTADALLPGARSLASCASDLSSNGLVNQLTRERLISIYGSRTRDLLNFCERDARLRGPLNETSRTLACEIVFAFEQELAQTLADCLFRRTMSGFSSDLGNNEVEDAAAIAQRFLGWNTARARKEVEEYYAYIQRLAVPNEAAQ